MTASPVTSSTSAASATSSADTTANPSSTLTQQNFLQLLVAQIQYQDPMNPQSDTQMASQMAQFSALTASTNSASSLAMMQANGLVGSTVGIQVDPTSTTSGVVTGVTLNNGTPQITVGGTSYGLNQINSVTPAAAATTASTSSTPTTP